MPRPDRITLADCRKSAPLSESARIGRIGAGKQAFQGLNVAATSEASPYWMGVVHEGRAAVSGAAASGKP